MATKDDVTRNAERDPDEWVTGDEPATGPQQSYLGTLAQEAGEQVPTDITKADASKGDRPAAAGDRARAVAPPGAGRRRRHAEAVVTRSGGTRRATPAAPVVQRCTNVSDSVRRERGPPPEHLARRRG